MKSVKIIDVKITNKNKKELLKTLTDFCNFKKSLNTKFIVTINPELVVQAQNDKNFKKILNSADLSTVDGIGIKIALSLKGYRYIPRFTGVDLACFFIEKYARKVLIIGGENLDEYKPIFNKKIINFENSKKLTQSKNTVFWIQGFKDIEHKKDSEEIFIKQTIKTLNPKIILLTFGSPKQEKWIYENLEFLSKQNVHCVAGVGGAIDMLIGKKRRAPRFIRAIGLEWLFRLVNEPWRFARQKRLFVFLMLFIKDLFKNKK